MKKIISKVSDYGLQAIGLVLMVTGALVLYAQAEELNAGFFIILALGWGVYTYEIGARTLREKRKKEEKEASEES